MKPALICVRAFFQNGGLSSDVYLDMILIQRAHHDVLETQIESLFKMGYEKICIVSVDENLHIIDSMEY